MNKGNTVRSNGMLLLAAVIWGSAFVAQRASTQYVGSFIFNGVRFALGGISLLPWLIYFQHQRKLSGQEKSVNPWPAGIIAGLVLFIASSFQQVGLVETTAGKAAFITGMYIAIVPLMGILLKQRIKIQTWVGVLVAALGLYFLSVTEEFTIARGDLLELAGAFFWSVHILVIDYFTKRGGVDGLQLSVIQCLICSALSLLVSFSSETIVYDSLRLAAGAIVYSGVFSVGIAYTLQILGQTHAKPSHAAIILSMESVVASISGAIFLGENLGLRGYLGCILMLIGMLLSQLTSVDSQSKSNHRESNRIELNG